MQAAQRRTAHQHSCFCRVCRFHGVVVCHNVSKRRPFKSCGADSFGHRLLGWRTYSERRIQRERTQYTIWCSAACGTLAGVGFFSELAVLVACVLVTHCLFRPLCHFIETKFEGAASLTVKVECDKESLDAVRNIITNTLLFGEARVNELFYKEADGVFVVFCDFEARGDDRTLSELIIRRLQAHAGVISAGWYRRELRGGEL